MSRRKLRMVRAHVEARVTFDKMRLAYIKWIEHRGDVLNDTCPLCKGRVVVTPANDESDISHALPICNEWLAFCVLMGAHSPKIVEKERT